MLISSNKEPRTLILV